MSAVVSITQDTFQTEVLKSDVPVLVDFWAPWCGPCRLVAGVVDEVAQQYEGQLKVVKVNTDEQPGIASHYGIRSIPTLMVFMGGEKMEQVVGAVSKTALSKAVEPFLS
ncbi:thioredoxin [Phormidium tenue]|uniref:Thioredoxin n=1 Tax=Phormidium tenue NIES-30 TaxID=549789 RepID=A0A1U7JBP2_9CYAN|nr:thioredoxin [Phormidium tenue]MBD2229961.1 thioredoxin [Phormidium tenue FACHB-1052]OKH51187.1 thioredoxin [Phormidium tenue NIES-30]